MSIGNAEVNVKVKPVDEGVTVRANENADPMHWPASPSGRRARCIT